MKYNVYPVSYSGMEEMDGQEYPGGETLEKARKAAHELIPQLGAFTAIVGDSTYRETHATVKQHECKTCTYTAKYMPGTKFEMHNFEGPMDMHRITMMGLGIGLNWHTSGDAEKDPEHYTESFDVIDTEYPWNNREGLTRQQCDEFIWNLYWEEQCK